MSDHVVRSLLRSTQAVLSLHILDDRPRHFKHQNTFLLSTNYPAERAVKKLVLKSKNAQQFMLCFYFFPQDGKFGQSLTWPDHGSDSNAQSSPAQTESLVSDMRMILLNTSYYSGNTTTFLSVSSKTLWVKSPF